MMDAELEPLAAARPSPIALLFAPDRGMEKHARAGRALPMFLFAWVAAMLLAVALAVRVDASGSTLRKLEMSGQLQGMSDRQIAEETRNAERVFQVTSIAKGAVGAPLDLGLACLGLLSLSWFLRGRLRGSALLPVAAATLMPGAIADLLDAVAAFRHQTLPPEGSPLSPRSLAAVVDLLGHPIVQPWSKLGVALDFYSFWAALMMGFGVVAVGQLPRTRALTGTLVGWVCWRLLTQVAVGGP